MTLTIEYPGDFNPATDETVINAALNGIGSCWLDSTYQEDAGLRRLVFKFLNSEGANAMLARIQQTGISLSRQEVAE